MSESPDPVSSISSGRRSTGGVCIYACEGGVREGKATHARTIEACERSIRNHRLNVPHADARVFEDRADVRPPERAGLQELIRVARRGEIGLVVIYSLSSISTASPQECMEIVAMIEEAGGSITSVCDSWVDTTTPGAVFGRLALDWAFRFKRRAHGAKISRAIANFRAEARRRGENPSWGRGRGATLSKDTALVSQIVRLRDSGLSLAKTAKAVGKPKTTVARLERLERAARGRDARPPGADVAGSE